MGKLPKKTKKFNATKLKDELKRRRHVKKIKASKKTPKGKTNSIPQEEHQEQVEDDEEELEFEQVTNINKNKKEKPKEVKKNVVDTDSFMEKGFWEELEQDNDADNNENELEDNDANELEDNEDNGEDGEPKKKKVKSNEEDDLDIMSDDDELDEVAEIAKHRDELEYLKKNDPEFIKYLQKEDIKLLEFGDEELASRDKEDEQTGHSILLTSEKLAKMKFAALQQNSFTAVKHLIFAFRFACHMNDEKNIDDKSVQYAFRITSSSVLDKLLQFCMTNMDTLFANQLRLKKKKKESDNLPPTASPKWKKIEPLVKSFLGNLLHYLVTITDSETIGFFYKQTEHYVPYFAVFPKIGKKFLQIVLNLWASADETSRIYAFLNIRELAAKIPALNDPCLKGSYLTYVRNSKFTSQTTLPLINFMANCVVELYGLNFVVSYQHAFVYVRQLAIHLRNSVQLKTKAAFQAVYNWQFINSLKVWGLVLARYASRPELRPLIYPFIQITFGVITLIPTSRYYPLRFMCIQMLHNLASATNIFINTAPYIVEVLDSADLKRKAKVTNTKAIDLSYVLKISQGTLRTKPFQDAILDHLYGLMLEYFTIYSRSIAFPELALPIRITLKQYAKSSLIPPFKKKVTQLVEQLDRNTEFIQKHRQSVNFGPDNAIEVKNFLPENLVSPLQRYFAQWKKS